MLRLRSLALTLVLASSPALAAPPPSGPELIRWLATNTDIPASHVAIAGPELVYSLEPLGPPAPTGEVIALVRTEPLAADWGPAHGFQSWEANLLFDCAKGRMRQIRSATYPERNRKGRPAAEEAIEGWTSPERNQPAEQLMSAACDANFAWPLRHNLLTGGPKVPTPPLVVAMPSRPPPDGPKPIVVAAAPPPPPAAATAQAPTAKPGLAPTAAAAATPPAAKPAPAPAQATPKPGPVLAPAAATPPPTPTAPPAGRFAIQLGRGPSEAGAKKAIADAHTLLGAAADKLAASTDISEISRGRHRYTAVLGGFPTLAAATAACDTLAKAGQACLTLNAAVPTAH